MIWKVWTSETPQVVLQLEDDFGKPLAHITFNTPEGLGELIDALSERKSDLKRKSYFIDPALLRSIQ